MEELRLPQHILDKAVRKNNEFGWREKDFAETIEAARQVPMAVIGGQVQYVFPDGTCELYWLSYDTDLRQHGEKWADFCNRTAEECLTKFKTLIGEVDFEKETNAFEFLRLKKEAGIDIHGHKVFILYFDDLETDSWKNKVSI